MEMIEKKLKSSLNYIKIFSKWIMLAIVTGTIGGAVGTFFDKSVEMATHIRSQNSYILYFLPLGGIIIIFLYKICKVSHKLGTNQVISSVRRDDKVPVVMAPLIFVSTCITHLLGGSAGREGAALQLGGSIGTFLGNIFNIDEKDRNIIVMCGMASVFSALFSTPVTATFFAIEVISVGIMHYSGLVPCLFSSVVAYGVAQYFHVAPVNFKVLNFPTLSVVSLIQVVILSILCALVSILFCMTMKGVYKLYSKYIPNLYIRVVVGGVIIVVLTLLVGTRDYNGAGMDVIATAINGNARPWDFLLKIIFTAITIGAGYKGGEIVPTFFIGATFGCFFGGLIGIGSSFGAAVGIIALFCGVVNCPVASLVLSIELFGVQGFVLFAIAVSISYMLSGYYGLYSSQKIVYSKLKTEYININTK